MVKSFVLCSKILVTVLVCFSCRKLKICIHTIKPTHALMLRLYFYTQFVITPTCFSLSLSSSMYYLTSIPKHEFDILLIWTCKTTTSASYDLVLHCWKWILYLHTCFGQILMYLSVHPYFTHALLMKMMKVDQNIHELWQLCVKM
jgi:hypothetical protein